MPDFVGGVQIIAPSMSRRAPPRQRQHRIDIKTGFEVVGEGVEGAVDHGVIGLSRRPSGAEFGQEGRAEGVRAE